MARGAAVGSCLMTAARYWSSVAFRQARSQECERSAAAAIDAAKINTMAVAVPGLQQAGLLSQTVRRFEPLTNHSHILLGLREVHRGGFCGFLEVVECNLVVLICHCHLADQI